MAPGGNIQTTKPFHVTNRRGEASGSQNLREGVMNKKSSGLALMPPKPDVCQECATKHEPHHPHNKESLYYQMAFKIKHNRWPSWNDAMAHCSNLIKKVWKQELESMGIRID